MYFLGTILASIIGYFIGSISWSIIIVRWRKGVDIRKTGSGNAGATNAVRILGPWWGFLVALMDGFKVIEVALITVCFSMIPHELFSQTSYFIPAILVIIGHCWPIYYKFKGGKAVSCFIGLITISNIWYFIIFLIVWWTSAGISRKVSLSSLIAAAIIAIIIWLPWLNGLSTFAWTWNSYSIWMNEAWSNPWLHFAWLNYLHVLVAPISGFKFASGMLEIILVNFIGGAILIYRHWGNIVRLKNHVEPQTFPRLSYEEREKLKLLRHEKKLRRADNKELKRLEKIEVLEKRNQEIKDHMRTLRLDQIHQTNVKKETPKRRKKKVN